MNSTDAMNDLNLHVPPKLPVAIRLRTVPSRTSIINKVTGSLLGLALGDALGAHVEFRPYSYLQANPVLTLTGGGTWGLSVGQWTDDTSMALCIAASLVMKKGFQPYDQLVRYKWWWKDGYMSSTGKCFDIGYGTEQSLQEFLRRQKKSIDEYKIPEQDIDHTETQNFDCYCSRQGVAGNGALMRLAPVPLFFFRSPKHAVYYAGESALFTHGDRVAADCCRYYAALIVAAVRDYAKHDILDDHFVEKHSGWFNEEPLHPEVLQVAHGSYKKKGGHNEGIAGKGYIVKAMEAALWAFWSDEGQFNQGALLAVNLGDDTDTTAAIYGQLAGAHYGLSRLPQDWASKIYAAQFIVSIAEWLDYEGYQWSKTQPAADLPLSRNKLIPSENTNSGINANKHTTTNHSTQQSVRKVTKYCLDQNYNIKRSTSRHQVLQLPSRSPLAMN